MDGGNLEVCIYIYIYICICVYIYIYRDIDVRGLGFRGLGFRVEIDMIHGILVESLGFRVWSLELTELSVGISGLFSRHRLASNTEPLKDQGYVEIAVKGVLGDLWYCTT